MRIVEYMVYKMSKVAISISIPDSKVHGANMEPTWVISAPDGLHVGRRNLVIRDSNTFFEVMRLVDCLDRYACIVGEISENLDD